MDYGGWTKLEKLGSGGQGTVFKARSPACTELRKNRLAKIMYDFRQASRADDYTQLEELVRNIAKHGGDDAPEDLGALKLFDFPEDEAEKSKAQARLQDEIKALKTIQHPAILRLLAGSEEEQFIVTEYHPHLKPNRRFAMFEGRALASLQAFRILVSGVAAIHAKDAIHRDIKLPNIFVASDGRLVLGDFGIVLFRNAELRLTETYERVGSRNWMAPWATTDHRLPLEDVNPTLDLFPLGKVLWCLISGRPGLEFWYFDQEPRPGRPANNLATLFPDDPAMPIVNELIGKCVVQYEENCLKSATELLGLVDHAIERIVGLGKKPKSGPWLCRMCEKGYYTSQFRLVSTLSTPDNSNADGKLWAHTCDQCGHCEIFRRL